MLDSAAYRANETNAKRAVASWRLSNINDPYIFQNAGFPVRADSVLDLAQILDTMQEGRFDYYMKELGGFTDEDARSFLDACLDYIDFYHATFQRDRVVVPLSTLIAHFVLYRKLVGFNPGFSRLLELGPGCGYLSFFLRNHAPLADYTQIESTESFYLLQSHINSHVFGSRFAEHALSRRAVDDHGVYVPKLNWHNAFHFEEQKTIDVPLRSVCNHYPWWRIGEVTQRRYEIVTSNANLNEFSHEALIQYLSLIREVLTDDGAIIAQCLGGGKPTYDSVFASMKSAGFVPVALVQGDNCSGRIFVVSNAVFIGEKHPLYPEYVNKTPSFPMLDRKLRFVNKMYFLNEEQSNQRRVLFPSEVLNAILDRVEQPRPIRGAPAINRALAKDSTVSRNTPADAPRNSAATALMHRVATSVNAAETNRLSRIFQSQRLDHAGGGSIAQSAEVESLRRDVNALLTSTSWRITAPLRYASWRSAALRASVSSRLKKPLRYAARARNRVGVSLVKYLRPKSSGDNSPTEGELRTTLVKFVSSRVEPTRLFSFHTYEGTHQYKTANARLSIWHFQKALEIFPAQWFTWHQLAITYSQLVGDLNEALRLWRHARQLRERLFAPSGGKLKYRFLSSMWTAQVGHIANMEHLIKREILQGGDAKNLILYIPESEKPANEALFQKIGEYITVVRKESELPYPVDTMMSALEEYFLCESLDGTTKYWWHAAAEIARAWRGAGRGPLLTLSEPEIARGRASLAAFGMPNNSWFVCLHVRERGFKWEQGYDAVEGVLNCDIATYLPAVRAVTERGGWVIRIGDRTMRPFPPTPHVIDYAHSQLKTDWMDVFLLGACRFLIGTSSGPAYVPGLFGIPCALTNWAPAGSRPAGFDDIYIPKLYQVGSPPRILGFGEMMAPPIGYAPSYAGGGEIGLKAVPNTAEEIREVVIELLDRLDGRLAYSKKDEALQAAFNQVAEDSLCIGNARAGRAFLQRHSSLLTGAKLHAA